MFPSTSVQLGSSDIEFAKFNNLDSNGKEIFTFSNSGGWLYLGAFILAVLFIITYLLTAFSWVEVNDKIEAADPINPPVSKKSANGYMIMNWIATGFFIIVALFLLYRVLTVKTWRINMERMKQLQEIKDKGKNAAINASIEREAELRLLEEIGKSKAKLPSEIEIENADDRLKDLKARRTTNNAIIDNIDKKIKSLNAEYNNIVKGFGDPKESTYYTNLVSKGPRLDLLNKEIGDLIKSKEGFLNEVRKIEKDLNVINYGAIPIRPVGSKTVGSDVTLSAIAQLKKQTVDEIKADFTNYIEGLNIINENLKDLKNKKDYTTVAPSLGITDDKLNSILSDVNKLKNEINIDLGKKDIDNILLSIGDKPKKLAADYAKLKNIYDELRIRL